MGWEGGHLGTPVLCEQGLTSSTDVVDEGQPRSTSAFGCAGRSHSALGTGRAAHDRTGVPLCTRTKRENEEEDHQGHAIGTPGAVLLDGAVWEEATTSLAL